MPVRLEQNALQFTRHLLTSEYFPIKQFKHSHAILILSVDERKDFFQLYDILLQGEETYNNRQAVCRLLNNLASVDFSMAPPPEVSSLSISERLIKGEFAVRSAIRSVLIYEISHTENAEF